MQPIRVLIFFPNIAPGGTERVIHTLLPSWAMRYCIECVVLANPPNSSFQLPIDGKLSVLDGIKKRGLRKYFFWLWHFRQILRKFKPDLVLAFGEVPIALCAVAKISNFSSVPFRLIQNVRNHESTFLNQVNHGGLKRRILAWALSRGDLVTGNSHEIVQELQDVFRCRAPTQVIYNPVDLSRFVISDVRLSDSGNHPHIMTIGRLDPQKGQAHLLQAFASVQKKWPDAQLSIIGEGPNQSQLQTLVSELGLRHVTFCGWSSDVPALLKTATIFCLPSLWEGMPNVLLEALAAGVPVVAFDCKSGPREILQDGRCGILVPVGDSAALAQALVSLLEDPQRRKKLSEIGRQRAQAFDTQLIAQKWIEILEA